MRDHARTTLRALGHGLARARRSPWTTWVALGSVPLLVAGLLAWAFGNGLINQGSAVAAVVNNDQPVTIDGKIIPLGRQLSAELVDGSDKRYQWVLTNTDDATKGLENGEYAAVVTIPPTFSRRSTSAATTKTPLTASQGTISVTTSRNASVADALLSKDVADATVAALNRQVVETYLGNVYLGFSTMHGKLGEAADGAGRLADGTGSLSSGSKQLAGGSSTLVVGLGQLTTGLGQATTGASALVTGTRQLRDGTAKLSTGAKSLADGTTQLTSGAKTLADGLADAKTQTKDLPSQTAQLADGARQVADGNAQLAKTVVPYANTAVTVIDTIPSVTTAADQIAQLAGDCSATTTRTTTTSRSADPGSGSGASGSGSSGSSGSGSSGSGSSGGSTETTTTTTTTGVPAEFCTRLKSLTSQLSSRAGVLDSKKDSIRSQIVTLRDGIVKLADGSAQVADGAEKLATASPALTTGIASAADGAAQLHTGLVTADSGARTLATGGKQVADGTAALSKGADTLAAGVKRLASGSGSAEDGARQLATGASQLADGAVQVNDGASKLADGLDSSRGSVPNYTEDERDALARAAATPAVARTDNGAVVGRITGSLFLVLALWAGALATFLALRPVAADALTSRRSTWLLALRAGVPATAVTTASATVLGAALAAYLQLGWGRGAALTVVAMAVGLSFTVVNQALVAAFGRRGQLASLGALVVTASVGVVSTVPSTVKNLESLLPSHDALVAVRAVATGSGNGLAAALFGLVLWTGLGVVLAVHATERRRSFSPRLLRRPQASPLPRPPLPASSG